MGVRGSVDLAHVGRRKKLVVQPRSTAKSQSQAWPQPWVPVAPIHFPGAGKSALSYASTRHTSFPSHSALRVVRSRPGVPPKVDSKVSRRSLLSLGSAVLRNHSRLAGACSRETYLRAPMALRRGGAVRQMDTEMGRKL